MKINFIVSGDREFWIPGARDLFVFEPFVLHEMRRIGIDRKFASIEVSENRPATKDELTDLHRFVDRKYDLYLPLLTNRLNELHSCTEARKFWEKALCLSIKRHLMFTSIMYSGLREHFSPDRHDCRVLAEESYRIPGCYWENFTLFQQSHFGFEQMFSIYINLFFPEKYPSVERSFSKRSLGNTELPFVARAIRSLQKLLDPVAVWRHISERLLSLRQPRVGILGSHVSKEHLHALMRESGGRVRPLDWQVPLASDDYPPDAIARKKLSAFEDTFDDFDRYFFKSLESTFPKNLLEMFRDVRACYETRFAGMPELRHIVSEFWITEGYIPIAIAILQKNGVRHINNEHNGTAFFDPFAAIEFIASLSDVYVTPGWHREDISNLVRGASLFAYSINHRRKTEHKICYIATLAYPHVRYRSAYANNAGNAPVYFENQKRFLSALKPENRSAVFFRGYPFSQCPDLLFYDQQSMLGDLSLDLKAIDFSAVPAKEIIARSGLIVVDYLATTHIESMSMDVPTVILWNPETLFVREEFAWLFESLTAAGICQTDPVTAAGFVESIKDDPLAWWRRDDVQSAKDTLLSLCVGDPQVMISYLTGLANE